jgi:hypothetical protein
MKGLSGILEEITEKDSDYVTGAHSTAGRRGAVIPQPCGG